MLFWLLNECAQNDIDAVVNANTLFYFGLNNNTRPIIPYLIQIIADKKEHDCDKWYRNPFTVYYFFSRCYAHGIKELAPIVSPITERILNASAESGMLGTSIMDTALGCCTLMNVGYYGRELQKGIDYIIHAQQDNGSWARWAFYYSGPKKKAAWGSEELTTGFCIEALARYQTVHSTKTADG